jgi:hypothetical protein
MIFTMLDTASNILGNILSPPALGRAENIPINPLLESTMEGMKIESATAGPFKKTYSH